MTEHQCNKAEKYGALYFYSGMWKQWAEKFTGDSSAAHLGMMTIAFYCKYCGLELIKEAEPPQLYVIKEEEAVYINNKPKKGKDQCKGKRGISAILCLDQPWRAPPLRPAHPGAAAEQGSRGPWGRR